MHPEGGAARAPALPEIGQTLGGKYQISRLLGEGGMAYVFEASHQRLHQRVAIKLLAPEFARDAELMQRFEREARNVAKLRTKHVARVMDVDATAEAVPFIVMEFLEGRDLDAELRARSRLPLDESVDYVLQACAAMLEAHGIGLIHRDLKPANLFLANDGGEQLIKVLDFGISMVVGEASRLTVAGAVMGTVMYMSPEQVRAQSNVDMRADIWALGVILYELVAGRAPWEGSSQQIAAAIVSAEPPDLRSFAPVPDGFASAVRTMMQRDPARRFASIRDVMVALAPYARPGSIGAGAAEQVMLGQSGSRARQSSTPKLNVPKNTMPMMGSAPPPPPPSAPAITPPVRPPVHPVPSSRVTGGPPAPSSGRFVLAIAAVLGVIGAAGVVLILLALLHKPSERAPVPAEGSAAPEVVTSAEPPPAAMPPPPATGIASQTTPTASARRGGGAGGARPTAAPPQSAAPKPPSNPQLL